MRSSGHTPIWPEEAVIRHNGRGRRIFSPAFKAWIIEQALQPGVSVASLAMHNQVNANQLRRWVLVHQRRVAPAPPPSRLLPVTIEAESEPVATTAPTPPKPLGTVLSGIVVHCAGFNIHVGSDAHEQTLRMVLAVVREQSR